MKGLQIKIAKDSKEIKDCLGVRYQVFTLEQGINENQDKDGLDESSDHIIAYYNKNPSGTARIKYIDGKAKLERMAVLKSQRGKNIGAEMLKFIINYCRNKKIKGIYFHSQEHAKNFYEKSGFKIRGKTFEEVGVPHVEMFMKL